MPSIVVYERHKDRNVIAFAVLCRQEPKIADTQITPKEPEENFKFLWCVTYLYAE